MALTLTVLGVSELIGTNAVLAAFVAGMAFNATGGSDAKESQEDVQEAITRFFDLPVFVLLVFVLLVFVLLGMALPWRGWLDLGWGGLLYAAAVLLFRRMLAAFLLRLLLGRYGRRSTYSFSAGSAPWGPRRSTLPPTG